MYAADISARAVWGMEMKDLVILDKPGGPRASLNKANPMMLTDPDSSTFCLLYCLSPWSIGDCTYK